MKRPILYLSLMLILTACGANKKDNVSLIDSNLSTVSETNVEYEVEKNILSKGFQSINPSVEIIEKDRGRIFLVNLGIVECSKADINAILRVDNEITIHTSVKKEWGKTDIVVPQIYLQLEGIDDLTLKDIKFNIVGSNYTPIQVKYDKTETLNKIYTQFKLTSNTMPAITLEKVKDEYLWNIKLNNTFSKDNSNSPLLMFKAKVNADNGEIVETQRIILSETIDKGKILAYAEDNYIAYIQKITEKDISHESILLYDVNTHEKQEIYSTHNSIYSAEFSPDSKKLAIIEHNEKLTDLYLVNLENKLTQKITPAQYTHTWNLEWQNDDILYAVNNDEKDKSSIFMFDTLNNIQELLFSENITVFDFDVYEDSFIFVEKNEAKNSSKIFIKNNGEGLKKVDDGTYAQFINKDKLVYKKKVEKEDKFELWIYDLIEKEKKLLPDFDIREFSIIDKSTLLVVGRNITATDYSVYIYNLKDDKHTLLGQVLDKNIYYNPLSNTAFFSVTPPSTDKEDLNHIYSINFDSLVELQ